ncbi:Amidase enhancer precursor [Eubacteriaceae bacterium CHKCI004]|nr:Amidase enhancer precursor [Eubacteriaceae bacterium CHKCI004]
MKKIIQAVLILSLSLFLPGICTMLITGRTGGNQRKMGVIVTLENGDQIDGEDFVIGMAASELSYAREEEALKAWVIVCRTNFVKAVGDKKEVKAEDLSLDYISEDELEQNNGRKVWLELNNRLEEASEETFGQVLCYGGSLIDALYHPVSIGKTVSASEIYSVDVPYLISVDSSQDVESEEYMDVKIMSYKDCVKMLSDAGYTETEESCKNNLKIEKQTENGFVQSVKTKDNKWTGEEWKDIFSLNSTNFYLENYGDRLRIVTIGKGHSMGMSLYGANALAQKDLSAATILSYYYPGTELQDAFAGEKKITKNV